MSRDLHVRFLQSFLHGSSSRWDCQEPPHNPPTSRSVTVPPSPRNLKIENVRRSHCPGCWAVIPNVQPRCAGEHRFRRDESRLGGTSDV